MTLTQEHGTSLGYGQQLRDILSKSDKRVKHVNRQPDRRTDRQTGSVIPIYFKTLFARGGVITNSVKLKSITKSLAD